MSASFDMPPDYTGAKPKSGSTRTRNIALGVGGIVIILLLCCCVVAAVMIFADPFGLHLFDRLTGRYDAASTVMPTETGVYMGVNLINLRSEKNSKLVEVFANAIGRSDIKDITGLQNELVKTMQEQLGVNINQDVIPWIGQYAGIGVTDVTYDFEGTPQNAKFLLAIETRDKKAADAFLVRLRDQLTQKTGQTFAETDYKGAHIYSAQTTNEPEQTVFTRSGNLVIIGTGENNLERAIDAQKGKSLADTSNFTNMVKQLPANRLATIYLTGEQAQALLKHANTSAVAPSIQGITNLGFREILIALSVVDAGMQIDSVVAYDSAKLTDAQKEMFKYTGTKPKTDSIFPSDTLLFVSGQRLDLAWNANREMLTQALGTTDLDEALTMLEKQININIETDLIQYLNGEIAFGLFTSSDGLLPETAKINLGFSLLAETNNTAALGTTLEKLNTALSITGASVKDIQVNGMSFYELGSPLGSGSIGAYGLSPKYLVISTSTKSVEEMFGGGNKLTGKASYQQVLKALPKGTALVMYIDIEGLLGTIKEAVSTLGVESFNEATKVIAPIKAIVVANSPVRGDIARSTVLIFIPTGK